MAKKVCNLLAEGKTVSDIEKMDGLPCSATIFNWTWQHPEFYEMFDKAREFGTHALAYRLGKDIEECANNPMALTKLKLHIEHWRWFIGKCNQRKYGDKTIISGDKDNPLTLNLANMMDGKLAERAARRSATPVLEHMPNIPILPIIDQVPESVE